jgi:hypothetical protein
MFGYVEADNLTTIMSEYEKDVQDSESCRRHGEQEQDCLSYRVQVIITHLRGLIPLSPPAVPYIGH